MRLTPAQQELVTANLGLVGFVVSRYRRAAKILGYDEAMSEGHFGLCRAAWGYDPARGVKFSTYAVTCIRRELLDSARRPRRDEAELTVDVAEPEAEGPDDTAPLAAALQRMRPEERERVRAFVATGRRKPSKLAAKALAKLRTYCEEELTR